MQKRIFRLAIAMMALLAVSQANAIGNGFYMGLMLGPATNKGGERLAQENNTQMITLTPTTPRTTQFGTRLYLGNQFSPYAAFEFGLDFFSKIKYDSKGKDILGGTPSERVRAADIGLKGLLPLSFFNVFAKAGVAMTYVTNSGAFDPVFVPNPPPGHVKTANIYKNKFSGLFGFGASYDINQSWSADLSYTTMQVSSGVSSVAMMALGFSYHFTDKYCGQFLCDD